MNRLKISEAPEFINQTVCLKGWAQNIREMGSVIFLDLRDRSGLIQAIIDLQTIGAERFEEIKKLKKESVLMIIGEVKERPNKNQNAKISTGRVEISAQKIELINTSLDLPFEIKKDTLSIDEEIRLKYRYLDLRSERMKKNLIARHQINFFIRQYLSDLGFLEVETPLLGKGTPEGSREFIVPSRRENGKFFTLPQSPQQYKQILMIAGLEKYFQLARCFRDEDQRADRQPEFTQLDMEMSFVDREEIMQLIEKMMIELVTKIFPEKKIQETPFPRISYADSMKKYKTDKPDLRKEKNDNLLSFAWVIDQPLFEYSEEDKKMVSVHHPFTAPHEFDPEKIKQNPLEISSKAYDIVLNGFELGGGSIRIHQPDLQKIIFEILGLGQDEIDLRFGHLIEALKFGAPPHGGIALGIDRIVALLSGEKSIREVIAFPKTGDARDPLTGAPSSLPEKQLKEANIQILSKKK